MATSTGEITAYWLADRFAEIEMQDMRVTEVRVRSCLAFGEYFRDYMDIVRGKKSIWTARVVEDRTMRTGLVRFVYEKVVEEKPVVRKYSRSRCFACGQPTVR